ncbi:hypothetical protein H312_03079 [Anncaliia algerae PRA339]|uniref:Uncharacterized protein n=1 Tax=Anncaliia algerae PRA339 TaxID=1288291 RepID=A0A059EX10_9MICR|nr:hypothetical protein H312_03079 [Anncaliia algerae PRA339]
MALRNQWYNDLDINQKYSAFYNPKQQEHEKSYIEWILSIFKEQKHDLQLLYKNINIFLDKRRHEIQERDLNSDIISEYINFVYDCDLFHIKICRMLQIYIDLFLFYNQSQFSKPNSTVNHRFKKIYDELSALKYDFSNNIHIKAVFDIVYKRILINDQSTKRILRKFFFKKYAETIELGKEIGKCFLDFVMRSFDIKEKYDGKNIIDLMRNCKFEDKFSEILLNFIDQCTIFPMSDFFSRFIALKNMRFIMHEQVARLRLGSRDISNKNLYSSFSKFLKEIEDLFNNKELNSHIFFYEHGIEQFENKEYNFS